MRLSVLLLLPAALLAESAAPKLIKDIPYKDDVVSLTPYEQERCKLDIAIPAEGKGFATFVWFYGGGLKNGNKDMPNEHATDIAMSFAKGGVATVTPNYRLSPKAKYPAYVNDAAAAFAWTVKHIAEYGGDPHKVFIGGHSAGGYLALLVGFDPERLKPHGLNLGSVAGIAQDFGNFLVTGDVEIGGDFFIGQSFGGFFDSATAAANKTCADPKCEDSRVQGQAFSSLTGIVGFSFGVHRVNPRSTADFGGATFVAENSGTCPAQ